MRISLARPGSWGVSEELTVAELQKVDLRARPDLLEPA
jgi:hypothetical protein